MAPEQCGNSSPAATSTSSSQQSSAKLINDTETASQTKREKALLPLSVIKMSPFNAFFNNKVASSNLIGQRQDPLVASDFTLIDHPGDLQQLRRRSSSGGNNQGPSGQLGVMPTSQRKTRDSGALLFLLAYLGFLGYIIWDGMEVKGTDINLVVHGHDSYGNICGRNNRPIKFVEKSGQNLTDKPYTKYTLINSHFERYTSIPGETGEPLYVQERQLEQLIERQNQQQHRQLVYDSGLAPAQGSPLNVAAAPPFALTRPQQTNSRNASSRRPPLSGFNLVFKERGATGAAAATRMTKTTTTTTTLPAATKRSLAQLNSSVSGSENQTRMDAATSSARSLVVKRSAPPTATPTSLPQIDFEMLQKNRTLLRSLKSSLMYRYPSMHNYSHELEARTHSNSSPNSRGNNTGPRMAQDAPVANRGGAPTVDLLASAHASGPSLATPMVAGAPSYLAARRTSQAQSATASPPSAMATDDLATSQRPLAAAGASPTLRHNRVHFDDLLAGGVSESAYDHMLVTPINTNLAAARRQAAAAAATGLNNSLMVPGLYAPAMLPGVVLNQAEASNQLLYLTECVSSCPADHIELVFYRCLPNNWRFSLFPNAINVTRTFIDDILTDVSHCYRELVYTFSLALVLSLGLLILLRFLASLIIWSCLMLVILLFLALATYSWLTYYYQILDLNSMLPHDSISYADKLAVSDKWLIGSIFLTFLAFATIGVVLFMRKRILLVTMLFKESGKAIADMPLLLLQPLLTFATLLAITVIWTLGLICLQSMKTPLVDFSTGFVVFKAETLYKIMKWYHVFAFLWVSHFAIACQHYVIGASVSKWYFSTNRYALSSPIGSSISELILYYLGSVALGSFLVAIFRVIRLITRQIQFLVQRNCISNQHHADMMQQSQAGGPGGLTAPISSSPASCCGSIGYIWRLFIWFFDNIVMIINRDAYVEIAIHGDSFLNGARRAFSILASNPLRLLAIKSVSNVLLLIAKVCVVFGTVSVALVLLEEKSSQLNYSWSPVVISAIYAYTVAHWFLSVYEMVIDALFICYCEDYEMAKKREASVQLVGSNFMRQILANGQVF